MRTDAEYKTCLGYVPISSSGPRPLEDAYVPILLNEEEQQRPNGNGDREELEVGAVLCDVEIERAFTGCAPNFSF